MRKKLAVGGLMCLLILGAWLSPVYAGDSLYGKIVEVKSADLVVLDYGKGHYTVRIIGIVPPNVEQFAAQSRGFVAGLVLDKRVQLRFEGRNSKGEMVGRLLTAYDDSAIKDVGLELVRAGLARKQQDYDYKYGELSAAEREARSAKRGLWSSQKP